MAGKLSLDVEALQVSSFETGEALSLVGTVKGNEVDGIKVTQTNCFTTPCCPPSVTCPTPTALC
jgi:hypothetical protein